MGGDEDENGEDSSGNFKFLRGRCGGDGRGCNRLASVVGETHNL